VCGRVGGGNGPAIPQGTETSGRLDRVPARLAAVARYLPFSVTLARGAALALVKGTPE